MMNDCKDYFRHHAALASCFNDLRPVVSSFSTEDASKFMSWACAELLQSPEPSKMDEV
jgi:hypothetical protein